MAKYVLEQFNEKSVQNFFLERGLNIPKFILARSMPKFRSYILLGKIAFFLMCSYIIGYNLKGIYIFKLSRMSNKKIQECTFIPLEECKSIKFKRIVFGAAYRIKIIMVNNKKMVFEANKKIINFHTQEENVEGLKHLV